MQLSAVSIARDVPAKMRDGITLFSDVYSPVEDGMFPVILMRTPYSKISGHTEVYANPSWYASHGYIVVIQDVRGRWASEGEWYPFAYECDDGYDSVEWSASLQKSNGRVGMYGFSYDGATQLLAAKAAPPHLTCIVPAMTSSEYYDGWVYRGGAFHLAFIKSWSLGLAMETARRQGLKQQMADLSAAYSQLPTIFNQLPLKQYELLQTNQIAPWFFDWLGHPNKDAYWDRWDLKPFYSQIRIPALHVGGWYDIFLQGTLDNFTGLSERAGDPHARASQRLFIAPWCHTPWGPIVSGWNFGDEARNSIDAIQLRWFDHWLKGIENGVEEDTRTQLFVMGKNCWRSTEEWPPQGVIYRDYYLHSAGLANSINGDGQLSENPPADETQDQFVYDPASPVPSFGGRSCCQFTSTPMGPADQWQVEIRNDVLVYTSEILKGDIEVTGPIQAELYAASSAQDTDWVIKLVDVAPDNRAINIADGILRGRYRNSLSQPTLLEKDHPYMYRIDMGATSNMFKAGHRIRVEVSSSNYPYFDRNLNSGGEFGNEWIIDRVIATQTIFHDSSRPSRLILPILPAY